MTIIADPSPRIASDALLASFGLVLPEGHFWSLDEDGATVPVLIDDDPDGWVRRLEDQGPDACTTAATWLADADVWSERIYAEHAERRARARAAGVPWRADEAPALPSQRSEAALAPTPLLSPGEEQAWERLSEDLRAEQAAEDLAYLLAREAREERCEAPAHHGPGFLSLQDLVSMQGVLLTVVDPARGKEPMFCVRREHVACVRFHDEEDCVTDDLTLLGAVLAHHPQALLGVVPVGDLLIIDIDTHDALAALVEATGLVLREHLVVLSPKGWHLYLRASQALPAGSLRSVPGIDLRFGRSSIGSFVLAPAQSRKDGGVYRVLYGTWGAPAPAPEEVLSYLGWENGERNGSRNLTPQPPCATSVNLSAPLGPLGGSVDTAVSVLLERSAALMQRYTEEPDSGSGVERGAQRTTSALLMAFWRVAQWCGLSPEQAVEVALDYRPALAIKVTAERRSKKWALADAERVYAKPHMLTSGARARRLCDGSEGASTVAGLVARAGSSLPAVWKFCVGLVWQQQRTEGLGIGTDQVGRAVGISTKGAAKCLLKLQEHGLLVRTAEHVRRYGKDRSEENRVREFTVRHVHFIEATPEAEVIELRAPAVWEEAMGRDAA